MKYTLKDLKLKFKYNPKTGVVWILNSGRWGKTKVARSVSSDGYYRSLVNIGGGKYALLIHRVAYQLYHNRLLSEDEVIDHDNQNKLDNRIQNLILTTRAGNNKNLAIRGANKSGVSNCYKLPSGKYRVQIRVDKKSIHIGCFDTLEQAAVAKKDANKKYGFNENHN